MKNDTRLISVLLAVVMVFALIPTAFAAEAETIDLSGMTVQEAIKAVLENSGMAEEQLGTYPADYNAFAESLGMIDGSEDLSAAATAEQIAQMQDVYGELKTAVEDQVPLFLNGRAQPIFPYTTGAVEEGYDNAESDIIRYMVYVETNYDTDADGKLDLVKALVQVPRAAVEGNYQAATIYEARPYITGCTPLYGYDSSIYDPSGYDISLLDSQPAARVPSQSAPMDTMEHALLADSAEWYYYNTYEGIYDYEDLEWYDYYLVRGFAVVECGGIGTRDSEGFETCGDYHQIDAYKCVIEWLHGDRVAYTDKVNNIPIEADWSNGKVGMTGRSYAGTTQFGLAATGVAGLETIVPVAGIAGWYEYTNSQGISTNRSVTYSDTLAGYCAGRYLDPDDWNSIVDVYGGYLYQMYADQRALNGDYGNHWALRDYTQNASNIQCPALIVAGLSDYNVRPKNFDLMYRAYQEAGAEAKILLHWDGHVTPAHPANKWAFEVNGESYEELLNKWFSHYLYGVDNGIENMAEVTAQNSHDEGWSTYDSWQTYKTYTMTGFGEGEETISFSSNYSAVSVTSRNWESTIIAGKPEISAKFVQDVEEDLTIKGAVAVKFSATVANGQNATTPLEDRDALMFGAILVDIAPEGETMPVYQTSGSYVSKQTLLDDGHWQAGSLEHYDLVKLKLTDVAYKTVSYGWMDLCNPDSGYASASAAASVDLEEGVYYDYTLYLQPTLYEVEAGHQLALILYPHDPAKATYRENYEITLKAASVCAEIPVDEEIAQIALEITADAGGQVEASVDTDSVEPGTAVTVKATASTSYVFDGWLVNGVPAGKNNPATFVVEEDTVIRATFKRNVIPDPSVGQNEAGNQKENQPADPAFEDVPENAWYKAAVEYAVENGIMNGVSSKSFAPELATTRAMIVTMLYRMEGEPIGFDAASFKDVEKGAYYEKAVNWAASKGIVKGMDAETFAPNATITREQLAAILYRYAAYRGWDVTASADLSAFKDAASVSEYAVDAMEWADAVGIINGMDGKLVPQGYAIRAQVATMVMRLEQAY